MQGATGYYRVGWDDGTVGFGSISGPHKISYHWDGAGVTPQPLWVVLLRLRDVVRAKMLARRETRSSSRILMLKVSTMVAIITMMPSTKRVIMKPRDLMLPPLRDLNLRMTKLQYQQLLGKTETITGVTLAVVERVGEFEEFSPDMLQSTTFDVFLRRTVK